jgi:hypothetical protein
MQPPQKLILCVIIKDRINIRNTISRHSQIIRSELPDLVRRQPTLQHSLLPRCLGRSMIIWEWSPILFKDDWLSCCLADSVMLLDPFAAPGVVVSPGVGIEMEDAIIESLNFQVSDEIDAFCATVGI